MPTLKAKCLSCLICLEYKLDLNVFGSCQSGHEKVRHAVASHLFSVCEEDV